MENVNGRQDADRDLHQEDPVILPTAQIPAWVGPDGTVAVSVDNRAYSLKAVLAAAYKLSDRCAVLVDTEGETRWVLFLIGSQVENRQPLIAALLNELADHALREQLEREFGAVRTLIVAQAFSEGNLLDS